MKILFIYPGVEALGIEYLSAVLREKGHETKLAFDPRLFDDIGLSNRFLKKVFIFRREMIKKVEDFKPDLICFSVVTDNYLWACSLAKEIKNIVRIPIIFGGIHTTSNPDEVIKQPFIDMICIGEGEGALVELVECLKEGKLMNYNVKNIWFKDGKGMVIKNEVRPLMEDLDSLPFPDKELFYKEIPYARFVRYITMTGRGCPYNCTYCCNNFLQKIYKGKGKYIRRRTVDNVIEELKFAKNRYNFRFVRFEDEIFTLDVKWLREFSEKYKREISLPFFCWVHPNTITEEVVKLLKDGGCYSVEMGVESTDKRIREEVFNRYTPDEQIQRAFAFFKKAKIFCIVDHILGLKPPEEELLEIANFYGHNKAIFISLFWIRNYPALEINEVMKNQNLLKKSDIDKDNFHHNDGIVGSSMYVRKQGKKVVSLYNLISLLHLFPGKLLNFIIRRKLYYFLNMFNTRLVHFFCYQMRAVKKVSDNSYHVHRYFFFCFKKILTFLKEYARIM